MLFRSYQDESFCPVKVLNLPPDVVLVIYVLTDEAYNKSGANLGGVVSHWSFVETDQNDPMLPVDFDKRFAHRIW